MIQRLGLFMGSAFLFGGLLGFVPGVVKDGMYFGVFMVNTPHNILHIASGTVFLIASMIGAGAARLWFQVFGLIYAALAAWGFEAGDGMICGVIFNNLYDAWGHAALALGMLLIGFALPNQRTGSGRVGYAEDY
jgi:Domain of unknown function (DUF4383)